MIVTGFRLLITSLLATVVCSQILIPPFTNLECGCKGKQGQKCGDDCKNMITIGFYTDKNCQENEVKKDFQGTEDGGVHCGVCNHDALDGVHGGDIYAKVLGGGDVVEAWFSDVEDCPVSDAPKPRTILKASEKDKCKPLKGVHKHWTANVYGLGYGDGPTCARSLSNYTLAKRDDVKCKRFVTESITHTRTPERDITGQMCCTGEGDCPLDKEIEDSVEFDVEFQLGGGGGVKGVDTDASLGFSYNKKHTVTVTKHWKVPHDQCAHLSWTCEAELRHGHFTECDGGDRPGTMMVPGKKCWDGISID